VAFETPRDNSGRGPTQIKSTSSSNPRIHPRYRQLAVGSGLVLLTLTVLAVAGVIAPNGAAKIFSADTPSVAASSSAATAASASVVTPSAPVASAPMPTTEKTSAPVADALNATVAAKQAETSAPLPASVENEPAPAAQASKSGAWASLQAACDDNARANENSVDRNDDHDSNTRAASNQNTPCAAMTHMLAASTLSQLGGSATTPSGNAANTGTPALALAASGSNGSSSGASNVLGASALSVIPPFQIAATAAAPAITSAHPRMILDSTTLAALRARMTANTAEWQALKKSCDSFIGGTVEYPNGATYPDLPNLGQGYEGTSYLPALLNEALCYQVLRASNPTAAAPYGAKAVDILMKMSTPYTGSSGQGEDPMTDDGYVIRFFGVGFGLGYDWLYDLLTPTQRTQVYTTANAWLTAWEDPNGKAAFEYAVPQGNYYAGYFHAKATIAIGTYGDNGSAPTEWSDWLNNQFAVRVQPYYAQHLLGGGWPEGFGNYGPLAVFNMSMPARETKTATGTDIVHASAAYSYPLDIGDYVMHFTWPSRKYFDDRDTNHSGGDSTHPPGTVQTGLFQEIIGELAFWGSAKVPVFNEYLSEVSTATGGYDPADEWLRFVEVDPNATKSALTSLPLSYLAAGMSAVSARSDWTTTASWMSFRSGPYVNNPGAGEEYFDQGSLALVHGATPLLVNAGGWVVHDPGGDDDETNVYNDNYGGGSGVFQGNRELYNVFYVRNMNGTTVLNDFGQAANTTEDDGVRTKVTAYEDGTDYVYVLGTHIEDMYRKFGSSTAVTGWAREIVYLRPNRFVVYDRTTSGSTSYDQYMAWHFPANPVAGTAASGQKRLDITYGGTYAGAMTTVLPANATLTTVSLYPNSNPVKAWQVQERPGTTAVAQQWLTVFDMSGSAAAAAAAVPLSITQGAAVGVRLTASDGNAVVVSSSGTAGSAISGTVAYSMPTSVSQHVITDLPPSTGYTIAVATNGSTQTITLTPGGTSVTTARGVLDFYVNASGGVQQGKPPISSLPISTMPVGGTPAPVSP
jgi:hypothetical protein